MKPQTVVRWHRCGFRRYWTWKSRRRRPGRPGVAPEIRELIRNMSRANPLWGAPRVHGELAKLGISISQAAVSKYMVRHRTHRPILGGAFSIIMQTTWCRSTFSLCRLQPSEFCSSSSSFATTVAVSFISMSPNILPPSGRHSKWSMLFHGIRRLGTWYGIETRPTERTSTLVSTVSDGAGPYRTALPVAESICRKDDRLHST